LKINKNETVALLGHNGAGKTTAIDMLTGMLQPTEGDAIVNGKSIVNDLVSVRLDLGLCQQHDVLFDNLTVKEHLKLGCELKNVPLEDVVDEIENILDLTMLFNHRDKLSSELSGGMRRKLSLGMAMIAQPSVIILDEPTSGLDPDSRRQVWQMIKEIKEGRSIIMST
jgi:ATP-binding cassette subfamily A (ABC1) protein 3